MLARFRAWWIKLSKPLHAAIMTLLPVVLALIIVATLGYLLHWDWTGLGGKKLWDWLQLLIIPAVLAIGGYLFSLANSSTEQEIALNNQHEATLQDYLDKISELLLEKHLRKSPIDDEVRTIARVRTLTVLRRIDGERKASVLRFLYESDLINKDKPIIHLEDADLSEADLIVANLSGADLSKAHLFKANLNSANLSHANLLEAGLAKACLFRANLLEANLHGASLLHTELRAANLHGADLSEADLSKANLTGVTLRGAILRDTTLLDADLSGADLGGATIAPEELDKAKSLKGATMPDGTIHP